MNSMVSLLHISRSFQGEEVLHDITLRFPKSGFVGIVGPSGCGKSTLLSVIAGIDEGYRGSVIINDQEVSKKTSEEKAAFRLENIGMIFQKGELLEFETALQNVMFPLSMLSKESKATQKEKALSMLYSVHLENKAKRKVKKMSGGERQRVGIARALVTSPAIILADEPTSALDESNSLLVMDLLLELSKGRLVIMVSHDETLLKKYVDRLIRLEDGKVISDICTPQIKSRTRYITPIDSRKERPSMSWVSRFSHASRRRKSKRFRTFVSEAALSLGLLGLGLSVYVSSSIGKQISEVFSSIVPSNLLVMEKKTKDTIYSELAYGTQEEAETLLSAFPEDISWSGKTYLYDFESAFPDDNQFSYTYGISTEILSGFSSRNINDFLNCEGLRTYPETLPTLAFDDLVLGLPYETMAQLCAKFGLLRGYEFLGDYCSQGRFRTTLTISNLSWNLSESMTFYVQGVLPSTFPLIYHTDPSWNQKILEGYFNIIDVGDGIPLSPQEASSIPFVELRSSPSRFFKKCRARKGLEKIAFDSVNSTYAPSICPYGASVSLPRLYLLRMPSRGLSFEELDFAMKEEKELLGRLPSNQNFYYASTDSSLTGFRNRFFLAKDSASAEEVERGYSDLPLESANLLGTLPEGCVEGSLIASGTSQLRVSADLTGINGQIPSNVNEVVLSSSLMEKWNSPEKVNVVMETSQETVGSNLSRTFERRELLVVGSKKEAHDTIFVPNDWTMDFFLDELGVSPLYLEPTGCAFFFDEGANGNSIQTRLSSLLPGVSFSCPSQEVMKSLNETTSYLSVVLLFFSAVAFVSSVLLFALVISLSIAEGFGEAKTLFAIGVGKKEIAQLYSSSAILYCGSAFFGASLSILASEIFVSIFLSLSFGAPLSVRISLSPLLWMVGVGALLTLIAVFISTHILKGKDLGSRALRYS